MSQHLFFTPYASCPHGESDCIFLWSTLHLVKISPRFERNCIGAPNRISRCFRRVVGCIITVLLLACMIVTSHPSPLGCCSRHQAALVPAYILRLERSLFLFVLQRRHVTPCIRLCEDAHHEACQDERLASVHDVSEWGRQGSRNHCTTIQTRRLAVVRGALVICGLHCGDAACSFPFGGCSFVFMGCSCLPFLIAVQLV